MKRTPHLLATVLLTKIFIAVSEGAGPTRGRSCFSTYIQCDFSTRSYGMRWVGCTNLCKCWGYVGGQCIRSHLCAPDQFYCDCQEPRGKSDPFYCQRV